MWWKRGYIITPPPSVDACYGRGAPFFFLGCSPIRELKTSLFLHTKTNLDKNKLLLIVTGWKNPMPWGVHRRESWRTKNGQFFDDFGLTRPVLQKPFSTKLLPPSDCGYFFFVCYVYVCVSFFFVLFVTTNEQHKNGSRRDVGFWHIRSMFFFSCRGSMVPKKSVERRLGEKR